MNRATRRQILGRLLGIPERRGDLAPERRGEFETDGLIVEKWLISAEPGSKIPLNLYRPKTAAGPLPAIVLTCGHGSSKSSPHMTYVARTVARLGAVCLVADPLGEEERHPQGGMGTREHDLPDMAYRSEWTGRSVMGKFVFDAMRALDFLETRDGVDPARLGAAGNSLGGAVAGWLYALEPRLRMTLVSGWAFSDVLRRYGKHCTRAPNHKLRAVCSWPEFLALGAAQGPLLVMNGDADPIIDPDLSGTVWRDTRAHLAAVDPDGRRLRSWFCPGGGHRPYHGNKEALRFMHEQLRFPGGDDPGIAALPEMNYGTWCDCHGVRLEKLYGTELHYRGARLPDFGFAPIPRDRLAVLTPAERGGRAVTMAGWLEACGG